MSYLGIVRWTNTDKYGQAIAGVEPLFEVDGEEWRPVHAADEFPTQGLVFWPGARDAVKGTMVFFRTEENRGQKDEFRLVAPHPAVELVDLRELGGPSAVKSVLSVGLRRRELKEGYALIWCDPDLLIGPVKLVIASDGRFTFKVPNPDRIPCFSHGSENDARRVEDGQHARMILPRPYGASPVGAPTGYVDWDDDQIILRRALTAAVRRAREAGDDPGLTTRLIDEAAHSVTGGGDAAELELERFRLERARELCREAEILERLADEIATMLVDHPAIARPLTALREEIRSEVERSVREEIEGALADSFRELERLRSQTDSARSQLTESERDRDKVADEVAEATALANRQVAELDAEIAARVREIAQRPAKLLADVSILSNFMSVPSTGGTRASDRSLRRGSWAAASGTVDERVSLRRALSAAFKEHGLAPAQAIRLHAATVAGVLPLLTGGGGLAALSAYADVVCGGRTAVVHVAPDFFSVLGGARDDGRDDDCPGHDAVAAVAQAAGEYLGPSLAILEGLNRAPVESYLLPALQRVPPREEPTVALLGPQRAGLIWAATAVAGATTVPISRDLWAFAVAIHLGPPLLTAKASALAATEVPFGSDLMEPADVPAEIVEEVLEVWPRIAEARTVLESFAAAMARFESDPERLKQALLECVLLPMVASTPDEEERADVLEELRGLSDTRLVDLELHLRRRLA